MGNIQQNKKVVITGASAGLGLAMTEKLLDLGYEVWGTSRRLDRLPQRPCFHPIVMDLESDCSMAEAAEQIEREAGSIHILINNAGNGVFGRMESFPLEEWDRQWRILVRAPYFFLRQMLPLLRKNEQATVIQVTSLAARFPIPMMGPYSMGKAALSALTQSLQIERENGKIRFVDFQPGDIRTDFNQAMAISEKLDDRGNLILKKIEADMAKAPSSQCVVKAIVQIVEGNQTSPRIAVGDLFQSKIAPFLLRIVPRAWLNWGIRKYYGI
ncbi:MAG: SDR family NAD(P)-dependent oxidoreductase [Verrucomicrobiota bacterium]